jgi:hypothetical protein
LVNISSTKLWLMPSIQSICNYYSPVMLPASKIL